MMFPVGDWQFWVVTLITAFACYVLVKPFLKQKKTASDGCAGCPEKSD